MAGGGSELNFTAETQEALRNLQKVIDQQERLVQKYARDNERMRGQMRQQAAQARQTNEESFGSPVVAQIGKYAAAFLSIGTAMRVAGAAAAEFKRESEDARKSLQALSGSISGGAAQARSPEEFAETQGMALSIARQSGMNLQEAGTLATTLTGYGMQKEWSTFAGMKGIGDASRMAEAVGAMRTMGSKEDSRTLIGMLLAANRTAKTTDVSELGMALAKGQQYVKGTGTGDQEFLAALAVASRATKRPEGAATMLGDLAQVISKKRIGGGGLMAGVAELSRRGYSAERLEQILGSEAARGFNVLSGVQDQVAGVRRDVAGAAQGDVLADVNRMLDTGAITGAQRRLERTQREAEINEMGARGDYALAREEASARVRADYADENAVSRYALRGFDWLFGSGAVVSDNAISRAVKEGAREGYTGGHVGPTSAPGDRVDVRR